MRSVRRRNNSQTRRFAAARRKRLSGDWRRLWRNKKLSSKNCRSGCATSREAARPLGSKARGLAFGRNRENRPTRSRRRHRSEEHTSELQSHSDLVCRLLLEKKKQNKKKN